jgi:hypothetical protein
VGFGRGRIQDSGGGLGQHFEFSWYSWGWFCVSRVFIRPAAEISDFFFCVSGVPGFVF